MIQCLIAVGHDGLLRGSELCSGLKVANIQWSANRRVATFLLNRTKTHRSGGPVLVIIKDYGAQSGIALLRHHFSTNCLWNKPNCLVFPYFTSRSINWSLPLTVDQLRRRIKRTMCHLNIDPRGFGTHSLRAGGATDLFRAAVPYPIIKKYGRWKSDTALLYLRSENFISAAAGRAFSKTLSSSTSKLPEGRMEYLL